MTTTVDIKGRRGFADLLADRNGMLDAPHYAAQCEAIANSVAEALKKGCKVLWMGNGGSAAEAQHMSAELSGRFLRERPGLASEALSVNSSTVTAIANDYGYDHVFRRQVEAFVKPGDVVIGLTTSGSSKNYSRAEGSKISRRDHGAFYRQWRRRGGDIRRFDTDGARWLFRHCSGGAPNNGAHHLRPRRAAGDVWCVAPLV